MLSSRIAAVGALALFLPACNTEIFGGQDNYADPVKMRDYAQEKIDAGPQKGSVYGPGQRDPCAAPVAEFTEAVLAFQPKPSSIGCLPLISLDLQTGKPWVSELGLGTADAVASSLHEKGFAGRTLSTDDMGLRLAQANVSRASLTSVEAIAASAERLGVDLIVCGTIRRRDHAGALYRDVLMCELQAYDAAGRRIATSTRWEIPSDNTDFRRTWDLAQAESAWMPDSMYAPPIAAPNVVAEVQRVTEDLAAALGRTVDPAKFEGSIYVAPLDVAAFAPELAMLRAAQGAYASELTRRMDAARVAKLELDLSGKIVLNGTEFPSFQAAEAFLAQLSESFQATPAARFAQSFSAQLADAIRARSKSTGRAVNDIAAVRPADLFLVEGELAQGGIARSRAGRDALQAAGIGVVVAPRLEKVGDALQVRADAYDLARGVNAGDGRVMIPAGLVADFRRALAPDPDVSTSITVVKERDGNQWVNLYESVKSGVVQIQGSKTMGSGFLVRGDGLIVTNQHVVGDNGDVFTVIPEGGSPLSARVVASDAYWDLAALQVEGFPKGRHVFEFANEIKVGTEVAVLGNPQGSLGWVLTPGYVSSTTELVPTADGRARPALMYTSATRPGSSGSPVLLADGTVVAVHSAGTRAESTTNPATKTELTGFALGIPARQARLFAENIARP